MKLEEQVIDLLEKGITFTVEPFESTEGTFICLEFTLSTGNLITFVIDPTLSFAVEFKRAVKILLDNYYQGQEEPKPGVLKMSINGAPATKITGLLPNVNKELKLHLNHIDSLGNRYCELKDELGNRIKVTTEKVNLLTAFVDKSLVSYYS